jgi:hypothetical protein
MTTLIRCQVNPSEQRATNRRAAIVSEDALNDAAAVSAASRVRGGAELIWEFDHLR